MKRKKRRNGRKLLRLFSVFVLAVILSVLLAGTLICLFTDPIDTSLLNVKMTSTIYYEDKNGEKNVIQNLYSGENRTWADFEKIPLNMKNAFVAIEDERFYSHPGFDIKRLTGAGLNTFLRIFNRNRSVYGGSTITQQLVKNLTQEDDRSIIRKVKEIYRAIRLEKDLTKNEILELYLNSIYLSQNCNGVGAASRVYFDKDLSELNLAECASIAGITQYPSRYDPYLNPEANKEKQLTVLAKMLELGMISEEEHKAAAEYELEFKRPEAFNNIYYSYFVDTVIEEVLTDLEEQLDYTPAMAQNLLYTGGIQIKCTIDPDIQAMLEEIYTNEANFIRNSDGELLQSAMVVLEASTGEIKGVVGGMGDKNGSRTYNRATALRQPGSSIKPIAVYAPALDLGVITPADALNNSQTEFKISSTETWIPRNSNGKYTDEPVSLRTAVSKSFNVPAAQVLQDMGVSRSYDFLTKKFGITSLVNSRSTDSGVISDKALAALSLGGLTDGVSTVEMAAAYAPFINRGNYTEAHTYTEIYDHDGNLLFAKHPEKHRAIKSTTATIMTDLLTSVVSEGTGTAANFGTVEIAGKTGTTTNNYDKWFVGFTPTLVGATWVGYDTPTKISAYGNPAINLWRKVMSNLNYSGKHRTFESVLSYDNLDTYSICTVSGLRATDLCITLDSAYDVLMETDAGDTIDECDLSHHEEDIASEEIVSGEIIPGTDSALTEEQNPPVSSEVPVETSQEHTGAVEQL